MITFKAISTFPDILLSLKIQLNAVPLTRSARYYPPNTIDVCPNVVVFKEGCLDPSPSPDGMVPTLLALGNVAIPHLGFAPGKTEYCPTKADIGHGKLAGVCYVSVWS